MWIFILLLILILILFLVHGGDDDDEEEVRKILENNYMGNYTLVIDGASVPEMRKVGVFTNSKENVENFVKSVAGKVFWKVLQIPDESKSYYQGWLFRAFENKWTIEIKPEQVENFKDFIRGYSINNIREFIYFDFPIYNPQTILWMQECEENIELQSSVNLFNKLRFNGKNFIYRNSLSRYRKCEILGLTTMEKFKNKRFLWQSEDFGITINYPIGAVGESERIAMSIYLGNFQLVDKSNGVNIFSSVFMREKNLINMGENCADYLEKKGIDEKYTTFIMYAAAMLFYNSYKNTVLVKREDERDEEFLERCKETAADLFLDRIEYILSMYGKIPLGEENPKKIEEYNFYKTIIGRLLQSDTDMENFDIKKINKNCFPLLDINFLDTTNDKAGYNEIITILEPNRFSKFFPMQDTGLISGFIDKNVYQMSCWDEKMCTAKITRNQNGKFSAEVEWQSFPKKRPTKLINLLTALKPDIIISAINGQDQINIAAKRTKIFVPLRKNL